jgi:small GTP-binding protein
MANAQVRRVKTLKAVMVGESTVGKTSIVIVANTGQFEPSAASTVGACFLANNYTFPDRSVRLNIWDTAGQERYRALTPMYYREMDIACLVYAIDNASSFDAIESWYESIAREVPNKPKIYLIGNKRDLEPHREVAQEKGTELAAKIGAHFCEVSALADCKGVTTLFEQMAKDASEEKGGQGPPNTAVVEEIGGGKGGCC